MLTIVVPVLACLAVGGLVIMLVVWRKHKRNVNRKMTKMKSLHEIELLKRRTSQLDFSMTADQVSLSQSYSVDLPAYDPEWNFPSERLSKPVEIGRGAFGVVYKAVATGIVDGQDKTDVALKCSKGESLCAHWKCKLTFLLRNACPSCVGESRPCMLSSQLEMIVTIFPHLHLTSLTLI